ncbi:MAG: class B sortase [Pseudobutyrivibrio sp.]|nr:class B sortase [Pseudobutyrivibrio sp.]
MQTKALRIIGNILITIVILACLPSVLPKLFGLQGYEVISGSMEPAIPVGSIVYVKDAGFEELSVGDVVAFEAGASVVTHRIVEINQSDKLLRTQGDANSAMDFMPVAYVNVIGKVVFHFPLYGYVAAWVSEVIGKIVLVALLVLGVVLSSDGSEKQPRKNMAATLVLAVGLIIIFSSLAGFFLIYRGYQKSEDLYAAVDEAYVTEVAPEEVQETNWYEMIDVDLASLQEVNPDAIGWIYVEGTDISYPIMYSGEDEKYLHTTLDGQYAKAGSIFMEGLNSSDWSDSHTILYGHNMKNLSMFGKLRYYKAEKEYVDEHRYFQIITADGKKRYEIFSYFDTDPASWVYELPFSAGDAYDRYLSELRRYSYQSIDTERDVSSADSVVTLSTCSSNERRFTVHGYMVDEAR